MSINNSNTFILNNPGSWSGVITDKLRQEITSSHTGISIFQTKSKSFPSNFTGKRFHDTVLYMKIANNKTTKQFPIE